MKFKFLYIFALLSLDNICLSSSVREMAAKLNAQQIQVNQNVPLSNRPTNTGAQWGMAPEPQTGRRAPTLDELRQNNPDRLIELGRLINPTTGSSGGINTPTQPQVVNKNTCGNTGATRNDQGICVCPFSFTFNINERKCVWFAPWVMGDRTGDNRQWAANELARAYGQINMTTGQIVA
jgi:hypothetical protein